MAQHSVAEWLQGLSLQSRTRALDLVKRVGLDRNDPNAFTVERAIAAWRTPGNFSSDAVSDTDIIFLRALLEGRGFPKLPEQPAGQPPVIDGGTLHPSLAGQLFQLVNGKYVPFDATPEQGLTPGGVVTPPPEAIANAEARGKELVWDSRNQVFVEQDIPDEPPLPWRDEITKLLLQGTDESLAQATQIWDFHNQLDPGAKVELALRIATSPGDFVTYWALLRGDQPNVGFESGVRRIPFSALLEQAGLDAGIITSNPNLPTDAKEAQEIQDIKEGVPAIEGEQGPQATGDTAVPPIPLTDAGGPSQPFPATSNFPLQGENVPLPTVQDSALQGPQASSIQPLPVTLSDGRQASVVGGQGPEMVLVGEGGTPENPEPEVVVKVRRNSPIGLQHLGPVNTSLIGASDIPTTPARPLDTGTFPLLSPQDAQGVIPRLPAFGAPGPTTRARPLPALGAPEFQSAQQIRRTLPSEQRARQAQVQLGGFSLEDYLSQLEGELLSPSVPRRPLPTTTPQRVLSRV